MLKERRYQDPLRRSGLPAPILTADISTAAVILSGYPLVILRFVQLYSHSHIIRV